MNSSSLGDNSLLMPEVGEEPKEPFVTTMVYKWATKDHFGPSPVVVYTHWPLLASECIQHFELQ